jgi:hypothetical protein
MPPKAKSTTRNVPSRPVSTRIAAKAKPPVVPPSDNEEIIDIDAELPEVTTETEEDSDTPKKKGKHTRAQTKAESGVLSESGGPVSKSAAPSLPSELATTTQGRTAYDVRYFFLSS